MNQFEFFLTHSLEKVFPNKKPAMMQEGETITVLKGEVPAVQLVYKRTPGEVREFSRQPFILSIEGAPAPPRIRNVELVPSDFPSYDLADENYITTQPGLFPDLLTPLEGDIIFTLSDQYRAVWIDFPSLAEALPGRYTITVKAAAQKNVEIPNGTTLVNPEAEKQQFSCSFTLNLLAAALPAQTLLHTEWFHGDGLSHYYNVPVFSPKYWQAVENFIAMAGEELGVNMLLTPVFTPPLDTAVGKERITVQLVDIAVQEGEYKFGFDKLKKWCQICTAHGITHLEIAHFFTQWGAKATPKIMAQVDGVEKQIFGWEVAATSPEYRRFLEAFIPALQTALAGFGYSGKNVVYHISDEPNAQQLESYKQAKRQVADLLEGCVVMDALSDYAYYADGLVQHPVPANDHIQPFIDNKVENLWVYYCCAQCHKVPNRFYAMPSARNRIMGVLMYLYNIAGFLHWGYNFYNSQFSLKQINPYVNTHAGYGFPSGDAYLVYPGEEGVPYSSIRGQVQRNGLDDMRALQLLEQLTSRDFVEDLIYEGGKKPFTFKEYPHEAEYILQLREKVGMEIEKRL